MAEEAKKLSSMTPQSPIGVAGIEAAWTDLRAIVGAEHMRAGMAEDALDGVRPQMVIEPANAEEMAKVLKTGLGQSAAWRSANYLDWPPEPCGGTCLGRHDCDGRGRLYRPATATNTR